MDTAETHRKICLERQTGLRSAMMDPAQFDQAMRRLLE